jgi:hypothetical protein
MFRGDILGNRGDRDSNTVQHTFSFGFLSSKTLRVLKVLLEGNQGLLREDAPLYD